MEELNSQMPKSLLNRGYTLKEASGRYWVENKNRIIISDRLYETSNEAIENAIINFNVAKYSKEKPRWFLNAF